MRKLGAIGGCLLLVGMLTSGCGTDKVHEDDDGPDVQGQQWEDVWELDGNSFDVSNPVALSGKFALIAWNDLGMHCLNPTYDQAVILPPYNTVWAQLVKLGDPPQVVTENVILQYKVVNNTYSYGKTDKFGGDYAQFWDHAEELFGAAPPKDKGLNLKDPTISNGLSGTMQLYDTHFEVDGVPATPVDDDGLWSPYQRIQIVARDTAGNVLATTTATLPTSNEINCAKCHGADPFSDILAKHGGADLTAMGPVLCASCHGSPALGTEGPGSSGRYLSDAIHSFHADKDAHCYDCHPGNETQCNRSKAHTGADGNCTNCHGDLTEVGGSVASGDRIPWVDEPTCAQCHEGVHGVDTGDALYRDSFGHGGLACAACHGSPHAMVPSTLDVDNDQYVALQGDARSLGSCGVCHDTSKGPSGEEDEFDEKHAGTNPERKSACHTCHTAVSNDKTKWPHQFQWQARTGSGKVGEDD